MSGRWLLDRLLLLLWALAGAVLSLRLYQWLGQETFGVLLLIALLVLWLDNRRLRRLVRAQQGRALHG